jgi:hypothetical protein
MQQRPFHETAGARRGAASAHLEKAAPTLHALPRQQMRERAASPIGGYSRCCISEDQSTHLFCKEDLCNETPASIG